MLRFAVVCFLLAGFLLTFAISAYPLEVLELGGNTEGPN